MMAKLTQKTLVRSLIKSLLDVQAYDVYLIAFINMLVNLLKEHQRLVR